MKAVPCSLSENNGSNLYEILKEKINLDHDQIDVTGIARIHKP